MDGPPEDPGLMASSIKAIFGKLKGGMQARLERTPGERPVSVTCPSILVRRGSDRSLALATDQRGPTLRHVRQVHYQYVQLYDEHFLDLLDPPKEGGGAGGAKLTIAEGPNFTYLKGAKTASAASADALEAAVTAGSAFRAHGKTNMNDASSRSHAILLVILAEEGKPFESGTVLCIGTLKAPPLERQSPPYKSPVTTVLLAPGGSPFSRGATELLGSLPGAVSWPRGSPKVTHLRLFPTRYMVDLAGSERQKRSGVSGQGLSEMIANNAALSSLGRGASRLPHPAHTCPTHAPHSALPRAACCVLSQRGPCA